MYYICIVVLQCDQTKEGMVNSVAKMDEFCKENMFSAWYETSAKENVHIDDAAKTLVSQVQMIFYSPLKLI